MVQIFSRTPSYYLGARNKYCPEEPDVTHLVPSHTPPQIPHRRKTLPHRPK